MAVVPVPKTWATAEVMTAADVNAYISTLFTFDQNVPMAQLRQTAAQSIPNGAFTALTFDTEDLDDNPDGSANHSTSVNTDRFTAVYEGWYDFDGACGWVANSTGRRLLAWYKNGSAVTASEVGYATLSGIACSYPAKHFTIYLDVGDYVQLRTYQDSGGALNTASGTSTTQASMAGKWARRSA